MKLYFYFLETYGANKGIKSAECEVTEKPKTYHAVSKFPKGYFVPGRMAMTCCAEDMAFIGYACRFDGADELKEKQWVKVTAVVKKEYFSDYKGEGPVLYAQSVVPTKRPEEDIINFGA